MAGLASLPMYDRPELHAATRQFWDAIRTALPDAPGKLSSAEDLWALWRSPDLWLAQTCGLPYRACLHGTVSLVGTPDYGLDECAPGYYRSVIVARRSDPRRAFSEFKNARLAYNEPLSQSGWAAPYFHARKHGFSFEDLVSTGAHDASAQAVATGAADLAAIDAQSWRLMRRYDAWTETLQIIDQTDPTPGLPYITAQHRDAARIATAVSRAIAALAPADRQALGLKSLVKISHETYIAQPIPDAPGQK